MNILLKIVWLQLIFCFKTLFFFKNSFIVFTLYILAEDLGNHQTLIKAEQCPPQGSRWLKLLVRIDFKCFKEHLENFSNKYLLKISLLFLHLFFWELSINILKLNGNKSRTIPKISNKFSLDHPDVCVYTSHSFYR